jgi:hypothetical protein
LVEQLIRNQQVAGSNPANGSNVFSNLQLGSSRAARSANKHLNQRPDQANRGAMLFQELRSTVGLAGPLREALAPLAERLISPSSTAPPCLS